MEVFYLFSSIATFAGLAIPVMVWLIMAVCWTVYYYLFLRY